MWLFTEMEKALGRADLVEVGRRDEGPCFGISTLKCVFSIQRGTMSWPLGQ